MSERTTARLGARPQAVNTDVVAFVRLGFGDSHRLPVRSLDFEVEIPNRATLQTALTDGVVGYNSMSGAAVAQLLCPMWDDLSTVSLGRATDPIVRLWLPFTRQQRNGGDNALSIALTADERAELVSRIRDVAAACHATPTFSTTRKIGRWTVKQPAIPAQMRLIWQS